MILVIDNYDSFTWNLVDILRRGPAEVRVVRNDAITLEEIRALNPWGILISPGPGRPMDSGVSVDVVRHLHEEIPLLGICLGMQLMGELFGLKLLHAKAPMHGKTDTITHDGQGLFHGLPLPMRVMRYHSLILDNNVSGKDVIITAQTEDGEPMGIRHKKFNFVGVQFHPESILTEEGAQIIYNWLLPLYEKAGVKWVPPSRKTHH